MVGAAIELKPKLFLMENVPGMQSARKEEMSFLEAVARRLEQEGGYRTEVWQLNASAFGVPQDRVRCFLVASRLSLMPARPPQEYQDVRRQDIDLDALPAVGLAEAIMAARRTIMQAPITQSTCRKCTATSVATTPRIIPAMPAQLPMREVRTSLMPLSESTKRIDATP